MTKSIEQLKLEDKLALANYCGAKHLLPGFKIDDEILQKIDGIQWDHFKQRLPLWGDIEQTIIFWE